MPNHTSNLVTISGPKEKLEEMRAKYFRLGRDEEPGTLDLNAIVPMPEILANSTKGSFAPDVVDARRYAQGVLSPDRLRQIFYVGSDSLHPEYSGLSNEEILEKMRGQFPDRVEIFLCGVQAYKETGYTNWYDWSIQNWGTKWNAYDGSVSDIQRIPRASNYMMEATFNSAWSPPKEALEVLSGVYPECSFHCYALDEGGGFATESHIVDGFSDEHEWDWRQMAEEIFCFEFDDYDDEEKESEAANGRGESPEAPTSRGLSSVTLD